MNEFLLWMTITSFCLQLIFWAGYGLSLKNHKRKKALNVASDLKVSIVICAHNEADNLNKFLLSFLAQRNVDFELIVVNDHSDDDTLSLLKKFEQEYDQLRIVQMEGQKSRGKKAALRAGIESATHEIILLSDADCRPVDENWAKTMASSLNDQHKIAIGYSPFEEKNTGINGFARFENVITAFQYFGLGIIGLPYMGVGRNIGYAKSLMQKMNYFEAHKDILSGDDDLTVQQGLKHTKAQFVLDPESFVMTQSAETSTQYFKQKQRHYSVSGRYPLNIKIILGIFSLSWAGFYTGIFLMFVFQSFLPAIILLFIRWVLLFFSFQLLRNIFKQRFSLLQLIVFDAVYPFLTGILTIFGLLKTRKNWK